MRVLLLCVIMSHGILATFPLISAATCTSTQVDYTTDSSFRGIYVNANTECNSRALYLKSTYSKSSLTSSSSPNEFASSSSTYYLYYTNGYWVIGTSRCSSKNIYLSIMFVCDSNIPIVRSSKRRTKDVNNAYDVRAEGRNAATPGEVQSGSWYERINRKWQRNSDLIVRCDENAPSTTTSPNEPSSSSGTAVWLIVLYVFATLVVIGLVSFVALSLVGIYKGKKRRPTDVVESADEPPPYEMSLEFPTLSAYPADMEMPPSYDDVIAGVHNECDVAPPYSAFAPGDSPTAPDRMQGYTNDAFVN
ncbi:hypothetical protein CAPTEDRAFT_188137 [Capitella teleta]|uniref:Uncharacterized protein n=1 Tax=Capitella teleta TaxID=283909 RepID=R7UZP0_CAPTE|nr:hypothetical protein CAPTEDRAFT_188137 [Capitella teleta]|eukprot:ELU12053.1 hypothetical protein CAPTEDRAFT_188137 [Capitella teleta]